MSGFWSKEISMSRLDILLVTCISKEISMRRLDILFVTCISKEKPYLVFFQVFVFMSGNWLCLCLCLLLMFGLCLRLCLCILLDVWSLSGKQCVCFPPLLLVQVAVWHILTRLMKTLITITIIIICTSARYHPTNDNYHHHHHNWQCSDCLKRHIYCFCKWQTHLMKAFTIIIIIGGNISTSWSFLNKGIGDAGSTADFRMLWSAIVFLGFALL